MAPVNMPRWRTARSLPVSLMLGASDAACACRYPYLTSSTAGFALQEAVKRADMRALGSRISAGLAAGSWDVPTLILTGDADKFIKVRYQVQRWPTPSLNPTMDLISTPALILTSVLTMTHKTNLA